MDKKHCISDCDHERHKSHREKLAQAKEAMLEGQYYWCVARYVTDRNISPSDVDDLEFFQDSVFESPWGRIHIFFYEWMFKKYYQSNPDWYVLVFTKYLEYLDKISPLFSQDAFYFVFRQNNIQLVESVLKAMSFDIKLRFIKASEKYPDMIRKVPKLKLYNLFS